MNRLDLEETDSLNLIITLILSDPLAWGNQQSVAWKSCDNLPRGKGDDDGEEVVTGKLFQ